MQAIASAARDLAAAIAADGLGDALGAHLGQNSDGDRQAALDVIADAAFRTALAGTGVRWYASEELETVSALDAEGRLAIAIDPLDGSSNIDVNVSIGTIFGFYPAEDDADASFLRPGRDLRAAGYVIYGPQTALVASFGDGRRQASCSTAATGVFRRVAAARSHVPTCSSEYAINASNYRHWPQPIRAYVDDCLAGAEGPHACDFNMRWIASLVAEVHRIVTRGGVFLYPADRRARLRARPPAPGLRMRADRLPDRAGRRQGHRRLRPASSTSAPTSLHERTPFVFGSAEKVDRVAAYHDLPEAETSALFGKRGLFRERAAVSRKHPIISVTGSSGAGTTTVKHTFDQIFRREGIKAVSIEGDAFHRYDRAAMKAELDARLKARATRPSATSATRPTSSRTSSGSSASTARPAGAARGTTSTTTARRRPTAPRPAPSPTGRPSRTTATCCSTRACTAPSTNGDVNLSELADLKIGVVPVINLEWIQKIHRDRASRGYTTEAVTDVILRRMHAYVHCICPQFTETDINFQRVPVVDTSNPFIARWIPTADESLVVIRFRIAQRDRLPLPRLDDPRQLDEPGELDRHPRKQARPRHAADPDAADPAACRHRQARLKERNMTRHETLPPPADRESRWPTPSASSPWTRSRRRNSGHPGMPMGMADVAAVLFNRFLNIDPDGARLARPRPLRAVRRARLDAALRASTTCSATPTWARTALRGFRQLGSPTPGHPEYGHTLGVETTTGPLGQGLATAVGMALAERMLNARFGDGLVDHCTYVIAGDGCLMEGISHEAIDLAGHLRLGRLIVLWDDNRITIDGPTALSTSIDQPAALRGRRLARRRPSTATTPRRSPPPSRRAQADPRPVDDRLPHGDRHGRADQGRAATPSTARRSAPTRSPRPARRSAGRMRPSRSPAAVRAAWAGRRRPRRRGARRLAARGSQPRRSAPAFEAALRAGRRRPLSAALRGAQARGSSPTRRRSPPARRRRWRSRWSTPSLPNTVGGSADLTGSNNTRTKGMQPRHRRRLSPAATSTTASASTAWRRR